VPGTNRNLEPVEKYPKLPVGNLVGEQAMLNIGVEITTNQNTTI
jgi:hypothetical protein